MSTDSTPKKSILHLCKREILRPLRDQILRISGYEVESTCDFAEGLTIFRTRPFDLVIVDVEGEEGIHIAERFCSEVKTTHHGQLVAFVCNWRVAALTDCPDEIIRSEFNPAAFVAGVRATLNDA
jgi:DNA-binding response OmpR family regulator